MMKDVKGEGLGRHFEDFYTYHFHHAPYVVFAVPSETLKKTHYKHIFQTLSGDVPQFPGPQTMCLVYMPCMPTDLLVKLVNLVNCLRVRSSHSSFAGDIGDQHGTSTLEALEAENTTCISKPPTNHFLQSHCLLSLLEFECETTAQQHDIVGYYCM